MFNISYAYSYKKKEYEIVPEGWEEGRTEMRLVNYQLRHHHRGLERKSGMTVCEWPRLYRDKELRKVFLSRTHGGTRGNESRPVRAKTNKDDEAWFVPS